jgi:o-succinylbenzoate---CoA ligase
VATTLGPGIAFVVLFHALPRLGASLVPLNTRLPEGEQRRQAHLAGARLTLREPPAGPPADLPHGSSAGAGSEVALLFTSGTSGEPRPVPLTLCNLDTAAQASAAVLGSEPADRWLCPLPLFHVAGLAILVRCARAATTVVLHDGFDAARVLRALRDEGITLVSVVPTMLARLREAGLDGPEGLRAMLAGGGPVPPDLLEWARGRGIPVRCTYGMTETASQVVLTEPGELSGSPLPGAELAIAQDGEILVRGPMVAEVALDADGWLHTGDAGRIDEQGRLHVEGRLKELIVTGGENVAPARVEAVLLAHPSLADAAVAGLPDPEWGEVVTAYVVEREPVPDSDLLAFCRERLAGFEAPKRVVRVASIPRNAGGKVLRSELGADRSPPAG